MNHHDSNDNSFVESILDNSILGIIRCEAIFNENSINDFRYTLINSFAAKLYNVEVDTVIGNTLITLFPSSQFFEIFKNVFQTGNTVIMERFIENQFVKGWYKINIIKWNKGVTCIFQEISNYKHVEETLRKNEEILLESQQVGHIGCFYVDLDAETGKSIAELKWTPELYAIFEISPAVKPSLELLEKRLHPDDRARVMQELYHSSKHLSSLTIQHRILTESGIEKSMWGKMKFFKNPDSKTIRLIGTLMDVTPLKNAEEELEAKKEELERVNAELEKKVKERTRELETSLHEIKKANEELDKFAYVISHDLKSPLNSVEGILAILSESNGDKDEYETKKLLNIARMKIQEMGELIISVLESAKSKKKVKQPVDMNKIVLEVMENLNPGAQFMIFIQHNLPTVFYNKISLIQIFQNLIGNSIKYMDKSVGEINIGCSDRGDAYEIYVKDNGPSIPKNLQPKIFGYFESGNVNENIESTGLGLSIARKAVEENGGKMWMESEIGKGCTFYFTILK